jgi:hypothetical protein
VSTARMATVELTCWRDIPVLVTARDAAETATVPLSGRFQDLIDRLATAEGLTDADAYLAEWRVVPAGARPGPAAAVAARVAAELEARFDELRTRLRGPTVPD